MSSLCNSGCGLAWYLGRVLRPPVMLGAAAVVVGAAAVVVGQVAGIAIVKYAGLAVMVGFSFDRFRSLYTMIRSRMVAR